MKLRMFHMITIVLVLMFVVSPVLASEPRLTIDSVGGKDVVNGSI